ncbi:hypothetical protein NA78x_001352 [Anatilimnocola sp. NA78]|uniref:hypothetical protein n=1 Tax=Anatilimnocola sp. NA78 TaxID=3415683 RepID=UPI003CE55E3A
MQPNPYESPLNRNEQIPDSTATRQVRNLALIFVLILAALFLVIFTICGLALYALFVVAAAS